MNNWSWLIRYFSHLGSVITEDGECTTEFRTRLNRGQAIGITAENMEKSEHADFNEDTNKKALVWPVSERRDGL